MLKPGGEQHLTEDQLDRLAESSRPIDPAVPHSVGLDDVSANHVSECEDCRRRVEGRIEANRKLALLRPTTTGDRGKRCPSDEELMNVAAGIAEKEASRRMLDHAASCDHCGPRLQEFVRDFSDAESPGETEVVRSLDSSSSTWQMQMAARLSASASLREKKTRIWFVPTSWNWAVFGGAAAALLAVLVLVLVTGSERRVETLVAQAYTERRTLDVRFPGAAFGPLRVQRTQQTSHMDSPPSLLEAEKEIASNLGKHPADPFWLQSRARAEMLEGNYNGAIDNLQQARAAKGDSPPLLVDLATAYSQRADATGNKEDLGTAVHLLGLALQASPRDPVALFNRAVISRKVPLLSQAIEDWKKYLEIDPNGKWADEARSRLEEAQQEQDKRKQSGVPPLFTPSQFAALDFDDPATVEALDKRIEAYEADAILDWVPEAFPIVSSVSSEATAARTALSKLAKLSVEKHSDRWLTDLLNKSSSPSFPLAVNYLRAAIRANESGATETAHENATLAIQQFRAASGNEAGILRARIEDLYASNLEQNAAKCSQMLRPLQSGAQIRSYRWLESEARIQQGNCLWLRENVGGALKAYAWAANEAKATGYRTIALGAQDHWSMAAGASGDYATAWRLATEGLEQFWDGDFADVRGYNFYYSLYEIARLKREPHLEVSIWKDAIPLTESSRDLAQVAVAHTLLANSSLATNDSLQALHEFDEASKLFARSPQVEATRLARLESETRLAGVEISLGQNQKGLSRLRSIESTVAPLSNNYLKVLFYGNYGKALLDDGNITDGETAMRSALQLAELQLQSVNDSSARIEWKLNASGPCRDLLSLLFRKGRVEEALELWEAFKAAPVIAHGESQQTSLLSTAMTENSRLVMSRLRDLTRVTVISYVVLPKELVILIYDDRGVSSRHVDIRAAELSTAAARFRTLCSNPKSNLELVRKVARHLYDQLIGPVESNLQTDRTLIIELDEGLSGLPIEALVDRNNRYLGERGPIISSFGFLYKTQAAPDLRVSRETPTLVVAVSSPRYTSGAPVLSLPDVTKEGETVANRFISARLLTGQDGTLHETLELLPDSEVFHFAGHASDSYTMPGLLLSDATLTAKSLESLKAPKTRLAVLSACDTETGALGSVEAADSLVGYFVRAGVPRVVASRWNVDSAATQQFMNAFYARLLRGSSVEESIFQAQSTLRGRLESVHPFYWAGFTVFGTGIS